MKTKFQSTFSDVFVFPYTIFLVASLPLSAYTQDMKRIPKKWSIVRDLPIENIAIKDIYPNPVRWDDILNTTFEAGKWNILQNGRYLNKGVFYLSNANITTFITNNLGRASQVNGEDIPDNFFNMWEYNYYGLKEVSNNFQILTHNIL